MKISLNTAMQLLDSEHPHIIQFMKESQDWFDEHPIILLNDCMMIGGYPISFIKDVEALNWNIFNFFSEWYKCSDRNRIMIYSDSEDLNNEYFTLLIR